MISLHGVGGFKSSIPKLSNPFSQTIILNIPYSNPNGFGFKFFCPPGTVSVNGSFNSTPTALAGLASRADVEPQNYNINKDNFHSTKWEGDNGASLERLKQDDYLSKNVGGHGTFFYFRTQDPIQNGSWIYNKLIEVTDKIVNVHVTITVYKKVFNEWLKTVEWDSFGNPIIGETNIPSKPPIVITPPSTDSDPISIPGTNNNFESIMIKFDPEVEKMLKRLIDYYKTNTN